ncbi:MAG: hypothetical protein ABFD62_11830 [Syntrophaceae bacterium]
MKKNLFILSLIVLTLLACGGYNSQSRPMDQGSYNEPGRTAPSFAHPAGGTMQTEP